MTKPRVTLLAFSFLLATSVRAASAQSAPFHKVFVFGHDGKGSNNITAITTAAPYSPGWGFGFESSTPSVEASSIGGTPFFFSFDAPEGNYKITVALGADEASDTTVKAELRRLMVEAAAAPAGGGRT